MIEEIRNHFEKEYPREGCGVIGITKGKKKWFPCTNVAKEEEDFILCSKEWFDLIKKTDVFAIVHSHPDYSNEASASDINNCNALGIPYYIFSYPDMELNILEPKTQFNSLVGREYKFGVTDCFEAARDWLIEKADITIPPRAPFEDNWADKNIDYFTEEKIKNWGLIKVDTPKENDVLIFQVDSQVPNHCGVYVKNDVFFHHAVNRLSCRESLFPFWAKHLVGIYRYET